jgi:multiple sugar transport system ATP-binding protein
LVGPSGCGKTTTLRMIAGLERITDGELYIDGKLVNEVEPKNRDIAMVFQNYALYPHMTVRKNIDFGLRIRKTPKDEIERLVTDSTELLEIATYLDRKPSALSGGQRQRVAIGRAIVRDPKVFLMDEPLSNLDAKLRNQMRAELILLRKRINTTFIYVTHDQTEAMTLGDRIVIMNNGVIQQVGTPHEVFFHPANIFVAGFIGTPRINLMDGKLNKDYTIEVQGKTLKLTDKMIKQLKDSNVTERNVIVGVRPEHISLTDKSDQSSLEATIRVSEMMGSEVHLHVVTPGEKNMIINIQTVDLNEEELEQLTGGKKIYFKWQPRLTHLFDKETETTLLPLIK